MSKISIINLLLVLIISPFSLFSSEESFLNKACTKDKVLDCLKKGNLVEFDPLVGDTCCQIRALGISLIYEKMLKSGIDSLTPRELEFITLSKFLTQTKDIQRNPKGKVISEKVNYKKILDGSVPARKGYKLLMDSQRRLSQLSVDLVQSLAKTHPDSELEKALSYVLLDEESHFRRPHCAYYPITKLLLDYTILHKFPLLIKIDRLNDSTEKTLFLFYRGNGDNFLPINESEIDPLENMIVIEGFCDSDISNYDLAKQFNDLGVYNIVLATCATHPQFTGQKKNQDIPYLEDERYFCPNLLNSKNKHIEFSHKYGCNAANKKLFFLDHVYVATHNDLLKEQS